jgi:DNA polymerase alpha-associated DNA helicase A
MNSKIADFPNKVMYGGRLKSHSSVATRLLRDLPNIAEDGQQEAKTTDKEDIDREALETPVVFFDTAGCEFFERVDGGGGEGSRCNENEAEVVRKWIEELVSAGSFWIFRRATTYIMPVFRWVQRCCPLRLP